MVVSDTRILPATTAGQIEQVRALFREYAQETGHCECFQGFVEEIAGLPGPYAPPTGRLLLAQENLQPAGCVALRRLQDGLCEMKRLYVRPEFRFRKLGRQLAKAIIAEARSVRYRAMRLDTLPSMTTARALYQTLGFRPIPRYNDNPSEGVIYLELDLEEEEAMETARYMEYDWRRET
ncbi:MAG: GNAT family N-acetyltransferase [Verrucomicrobia bacterium]|nr:MAG: GNAT family N-acetyltransferase [Verrucomicrobiota bacterium]